ncbi:hypothetical protein CDD83_4934 [Cordyceps sp. RAO-2017]|nr:hypothetical protein CDD83_4934 [Cordyceps sp. RAO-2017]
MVRPSFTVLSLFAAAAFAVAAAVPAEGDVQNREEGMAITKESVQRMVKEFEDSKSPEQKRKAKEISLATEAEHGGKENPAVIRMVQEEEVMMSEKQREKGRAIVNAILELTKADQRG